MTSLNSAPVNPGEAASAAGCNPGTLPPSRQAALDLGRALADVGETGRAVRAILTAECLGPQRVHRTPLGPETVGGLVRHTRRDDTTGWSASPSASTSTASGPCRLMREPLTSRAHSQFIAQNHT